MTESADCRILVISPSAEQARHFVRRIQELSEHDMSATTSSTEETDSMIPWTIVNKYYTAGVHFQTRAFSEFRGSHADGVPAIVYAWKHGQPYRDHIEDIASRLRDHDPEVSLAVRFSANASTTVADEDGMDEFLSSQGFEFIEGDREARRPSQDRHSEDEDIGIPGLSRVLDALSTIMWPSLVQSEATRTRKSRARELLDWARDEEGDDGLRALISGSGSVGDVSFSSDGDADGGQPRKSRMQREMEELERWLAEEDGARQATEAQAWIAAERDVPLQAGSVWQDMPTPSIRTPTTEASAFGFDDDFTEFVSAPSPALSPWSHQSALDVDHLAPQHTGASYRSLASVSDFGGEDGQMFVPHAEDDSAAAGGDDDPDLPSRVEVLATSHRIFGATGLAPRPPTSGASASPHEHDESQSFERDDDDEFEMSAFDLPRVLSALQGMKEEIAGMTDDAERRKAAARVALGLVYGLQLETDD